jgi:hypothetical protein
MNLHAAVGPTRVPVENGMDVIAAALANARESSHTDVLVAPTLVAVGEEARYAEQNAPHPNQEAMNAMPAALAPEIEHAIDDIPRIRSHSMIAFGQRIYTTTCDARLELVIRSPQVHHNIVCPPDLSTWTEVNNVQDDDPRIHSLLFLGLVKGVCANPLQHAVVCLWFPPSGNTLDCIPILILSHANSAKRIQDFGKALSKSQNKWITYAIPVVIDQGRGLSARLCLKPNARSVNRIAPFNGQIRLALWVSHRAFASYRLRAGQTREVVLAAILATCHAVADNLETISECAEADSYANKADWLAAQPNLDALMLELIELTQMPHPDRTQIRRRNLLMKLEKARQIVIDRSGTVPRSVADILAFVAEHVRMRHNPNAGVGFQFLNADGSEFVEDDPPNAEEEESNMEAIEFDDPADGEIYKELAAFCMVAEEDPAGFPLHLMLDYTFCVKDSTAVQVPHAELVFQVDIGDQYISSFLGETAAVAAQAAAADVAIAATSLANAHINLGMADLTSNFRPKNAFGVGIDPKAPMIRFGFLEGLGNCSCSLLLAKNTATGAPLAPNRHISERNAFVGLAREASLATERAIHSAVSMAPLSDYMAGRVMEDTDIHAHVIGSSLCRAPLGKYLHHLRSQLDPQIDSVIPAIESYNSKTSDLYTTEGTL